MAALPDLSRVRRIWVRVPNWVGDFVMATASFARLRAAFPDAHVTAGMRPFLRPLLAGTDWFDEVVATPRAKGMRGLLAQARELRARDVDLAVVMPNSLETALVPFLARVPLRLGYRQGRPLLLNLGPTAPVLRHWWQRRRGPRRVPSPMPEYYRALLDRLGIPGDALHPRLVVTDAERDAVTAHLRSLGVRDDERLALFVVGANFGASKLWPPESFAAAARRFERLGFRSLITVGPAELELGRRIAQEAGVLGLTDPVLPLDQLKALVARAALLVTGDTGPRHLGVAFDRRIVCLIGPTDRRYTDYCLDDTVLIQKDLDCIPCQRTVCPLGHHRCMRDITVDEVVAAAQGLLAR